MLDKKVWQRFTSWSPGSIEEVRVFFSPGRVNLIGEHLDYNGGHVFPAALNVGTWAIVRPRTDRIYRFASTSATIEVAVRPDQVQYKSEDDWANYPKGILLIFNETASLTGADILYHGNLPLGAGLSSSASIEVVTALALNELSGTRYPLEQLSTLAQTAENQFIGVSCGIMDQFAVAMGRANHGLLLDCATLAYQMVPLRLHPYALVVTNTNKSRGLTDSKYNERRCECEEALRIFQTYEGSITYLARVSRELWQRMADTLPDILRKRTRHLLSENERVLRAAELLAADDILGVGQLLNESHCSLRDDFEVTGWELDSLVKASWNSAGCIGSRMTGAGFGGCTISLVHEDSVDIFKREVRIQYTRDTGLQPTFYIFSVGDGAREISSEVFSSCLF